MSDLLNQASLVMVPSGYKEDVVYSQIPTDGSGDLSFTRASNGTRINSAGLVEVCPWNFNTNSEDFTLNWGTDGTSTATNNFATAPNGTMTAAKVVVNITSGYAYKGFQLPPNTYTVSYYIKASTNSTGGIGSNDIGGAGYSSTSINITTEWQRFEHTFNVTLGTSLYIDYGFASTSVNYFIWGAQINLGTAKPYFPTTDRLNVPRLTYQNGGGGCPSLLLEKQSTNLVTYSEDFSNAAWYNEDVIVSTNQTISPDGTQNADKLIANTTTLDHSIYQTAAGSTKTFSVYAKAGEYNYIFLGSNNNVAADGAFFNLSNGTISQNTSGLTASIESVGNGWYRCIVSSTSWPTIYCIISLSANGTSLTLTGNNTSGIYAWGCQVEASSYPTSYIPTTSSSATRVVDGGYKFNISSLIGQSEGTIFLNYTLLNNSTDDITIGITGNNGKIIWFRKNGIQFYGNGTTLLFDASSTGTMGVTYKMAFVYGQSDFRLYINGSLIGSVTSGTFTGTFDDFTFFPVGGVPYTNANKINEMVFFKTKLTNAELAQLTA